MASTNRRMHDEPVELAPGSLVLADLHLHPESEPRLEGFLAWLDALRDVPRLIVLGDLFDVWIGPAQARQRASARVLDGLASLVARGTAVDVVPGNRDFLLDASFERRTSARLRPDGLLGRTAAGTRVLFVHGDELCTRDLAYQRMKRVLRSTPARALSRLLPLPVARWAAGRLRARSVAAVAAKPAEAKAMQSAAARSLAAGRRADILVCGHAHCFRDEQLEGGPRWIVLDAWGGERDLLVTSPADREVLRVGFSRAWS